MYKYSVKIRKVSGRLNESVLPSKSLVVKSKNRKSDRQVFAEVSKYYKNKYGLVIESANVQSLKESSDIDWSDGYEFSDVEEFYDFCMDLSIEVANELRADAQMSVDNTNDAVWGLVTNWMKSHKDIIQKLWQKKSSYNTDPSEYDIHVVKKNVLPLFLKKFGK
jgi:hypothetical protein